jgi:L-asparaginase / beta-aspartyl-peptidase
MDSFSLVIHGGAGAVHDPERYEGSLREIAAAGARLLEAGASALDAVTHCVTLLEDNPLYNAGRGSVLNVDSEILCDASIMDGRTLAAGAAAGVRGVRNPVLLARAIMEKSDHVFLIGAGAEAFAREQGLPFEDAAYFMTEARSLELMKEKKRRAIGLDPAQEGEGELGTVGAVARDRWGHLAAATSTGGLTNQSRGRVGDSPVIGAGTYADDASCAISCTGIGEHLLRSSLARTASLFVEYRGMSAAEAADAAIRLLVAKVQGEGGLIIVDRNGAYARAYSTPSMRTATAQNGEIRVATT